jgi:guanosine-3',5'-bis(diphosphate) 3'-pyrophosphohydrolase
MNRIKDELEDLCFEVLNPEARKLIKDRLVSIKEANEISFNSVSDELKILLNNKRINCKIFGREKSYGFFSY